MIPMKILQDLTKVCIFVWAIRFAIPREKRGIEEFDDEEFLTRKTDEENEELTGLKKTFLGKNIEKNFEN